LATARLRCHWLRAKEGRFEPVFLN